MKVMTNGLFSSLGFVMVRIRSFLAMEKTANVDKKVLVWRWRLIHNESLYAPACVKKKLNCFYRKKKFRFL